MEQKEQIWKGIRLGAIIAVIMGVLIIGGILLFQNVQQVSSSKIDYEAVNYDDIIRLEPKDYNKKISFLGTVVEIEKEELEGDYKNGYFDMIIWIEMLDKDITHKNIKIMYQRNVTQTKIREGDIINIKGSYIGNDYEKKSNNEYYAYPEIWADEIKNAND